MSTTKHTYEAVPFDALPGWDEDDHASALQAFKLSARRIMEKAESAEPDSQYGQGFLNACRKADAVASSDARQFFEDHFTPCRVRHNGPQGLLTGYYEPVLQGAREKSDAFPIPLYRRPSDLENMVAESQRGAKADQYTHMRRTSSGLEPYSTRAQIEDGALAGQGLEVFWLQNPVDTFFLHIQGSGVIALPNGSEVRVAYDGKNGHPYTSIGRYLIDNGLFPADQMTLDALKDWLLANSETARGVMQQNESFVFFREIDGGCPVGVEEIGLTPGRSLAVDTGFHAIGAPVYVSSPSLRHAGPGGFARLMVAQDVGSAIRGPERGDIFFGTGEEAGLLAGQTKHPGEFFVLLAEPGK